MAETQNNVNPGVNSKKAESRKKGHGFFTFLVPILFALAIIFGIWGYFIKANKFELGEKFRGTLKNIPVINMVLPPNPDPEAAEYMSESQLAKKYEEFREKIKKLNKGIEDQQKLITDLQKYKNNEQGMRDEVSRQKIGNEQERKRIADERKQLNQDKLKFAEKVKNADKEGFTEFFEKMDPDIAKQVYEKVLKEKQVSEEIKSYVKTFEGMEPVNAAKILENMGLGNIDLVANIMKLMKRQASSEILANMDPVFAANLADIMAVDYSIYPKE